MLDVGLLVYLCVMPEIDEWDNIMPEVLNPAQMRIADMLEDLNGSSRPHGLRALVREAFGISLDLIGAPGGMAGAYALALRSCVDLWLDHRKDLESKRNADKERLELRRQLDGIRERQARILSLLQAARGRNQGAAVKRHQIKLETLASEGSTIERSIKAAHFRPTAEQRARTVRIQHILEDIATGHRLFPAMLGDGYSFTAMPTAEFMLYQAKRWPASPATKSNLSRDDFAENDQYAMALVNENGGFRGEPEDGRPLNSRFFSVRDVCLREDRPRIRRVAEPECTASVVRRFMVGFSPGDGGDLPEMDSPTMRPITIEDAARKAAQIAFAGMLNSDWRRQIAKCESPSCRAPYFKLGKWNTDHKANLCLTCRGRHKRKRNQERLENNREGARQALFEFVAERFEKRIKGEWYKDAKLTSNVVTALNAFLRKPPDKLKGPLRNLYPNGITEKWLVSHHSEKHHSASREDATDQNWKWVEAATRRTQRTR